MNMEPAMLSLPLRKPFHKRLDLVVMSDRDPNPNGTQPLKALVNSLLMYTTHPINLNVVTKTRLPWLDALNSSPEYFRVYYHHPRNIYAKSQALIERANYRSKHYLAIFANAKLFLSTLDYPPDTFPKVLMLDDDMVFYEDITRLVDLVRQHPNRLSLHCPEDAHRVKSYFIDKKIPHNGHASRYCIAGMIGFPLGNDTATALSQTLVEMNLEYPGLQSPVAADQDVVNRYLAKHYNDTCDTGGENCNKGVDLIPCEWSCDWISCRGKQTRCSNCPNHCRAYHFLYKSYKKHKHFGRKELNWDYYHEPTPLDVLLSIFVPRIKNNTRVA
jgi:hypothetical protein